MRIIYSHLSPFKLRIGNTRRRIFNKNKDINNMKKVIKFSASWCGPCRMMSPIVEKILKEDEFSNVVDFKPVDMDEDEENLGGKYGIRSIPTILVVDDEDKVLDKIVGAVPEQSLRAFFQKNLL